MRTVGSPWIATRNHFASCEKTICSSGDSIAILRAVLPVEQSQISRTLFPSLLRCFILLMANQQQSGEMMCIAKGLAGKGANRGEGHVAPAGITTALPTDVVAGMRMDRLSLLSARLQTRVSCVPSR